MLSQNQMVEPIRRSLEYNPDPVIKREGDGAVFIIDKGQKIDEFKDVDEAKANYPEGEIQ